MPGRPCTICTHPKVDEINQALCNGETFRHIAARFGTQPSSLVRHQKAHIPKAVERGRAAAAATQLSADLTVLEQIKHLQEATLSVLEKASNNDDHNFTLRAVETARRNLELLSRLTGELDSGKINVNILNLDVKVLSDAELESYISGDLPQALRS